MTLEQLQHEAADLAAALPAADVRQRFIALRTELFRRGIFDPVLARFDSATVAPSTPEELAEHLRTLADQLR